MPLTKMLLATEQVLAEHNPVLMQAALDANARRNPHLKGCPLADLLHLVVDTDSYLEERETYAEEHPQPTPEARRAQDLVVSTYLLAGKHPVVGRIEGYTSQVLDLLGVAHTV